MHQKNRSPTSNTRRPAPPSAHTALVWRYGLPYNDHGSREHVPYEVGEQNRVNRASQDQIELAVLGNSSLVYICVDFEQILIVAIIASTQPFCRHCRPCSTKASVSVFPNINHIQFIGRIICDLGNSESQVFLGAGHNLSVGRLW